MNDTITPRTMTELKTWVSANWPTIDSMHISCGCFAEAVKETHNASDDASAVEISELVDELQASFVMLQEGFWAELYVDALFDFVATGEVAS